ncbi:MAG: response regulator, partial [Candidatus Omnitrophica bacterium]|nr:response regulator [Candidatus Omnitrophota bacterium]
VENLTSGLNAVGAAVAFKPDFILLDVVMPDIDGPAVYSNLKENKDTKDIPVVFLTAIATDQDTGASGGIIGGRPILSKPITTRKLIECIKKYSK